MGCNLSLHVVQYVLRHVSLQRVPQYELWNMFEYIMITNPGGTDTDRGIILLNTIVPSYYYRHSTI